MMYVPKVSFYSFASKPLDPKRLSGLASHSRHVAAEAARPGQTAYRTLRAEVHRAVWLSQDNRVARRLQDIAGHGSGALPRSFDGPPMPPSVLRGGAVGLVGSACVFGSAQLAPWAGLTVLGVACEISAALGLAARYLIAGAAALLGLAIGVGRGMSVLARWSRTTTLVPSTADPVVKLQPLYESYFGASKESWPPAWKNVHDVQVNPQFARDVQRSESAAVRLTPEGQVPEMLEALTVRSDPGDGDEATDSGRQQIALGKLRKVCAGDRAWVSHLTCVLNQSLGNVPFDYLATVGILRQGSSVARPASSPNRERHVVARRDDNTVTVAGSLRWKRGFPISDPSGKLLAGGGSADLRYSYRLAVTRPQNRDAALRVTLETAQWRLGSVGQGIGPGKLRWNQRHASGQAMLWPPSPQMSPTLQPQSMPALGSTDKLDRI